MEYILYEQKNDIAIVTINRPKALNALNSSVLKELEAVFQGIDLDTVLHLPDRTVFLGAGHNAVKGVAQPAEQQENGRYIGMARASLRHKDPHHRGDEGKIGQPDRIIIKSNH